MPRHPAVLRRRSRIERAPPESARHKSLTVLPDVTFPKENRRRFRRANGFGLQFRFQRLCVAIAPPQLSRQSRRLAAAAAKERSPWTLRSTGFVWVAVVADQKNLYPTRTVYVRPRGSVNRGSKPRWNVVDCTLTGGSSSSMLRIPPVIVRFRTPVQVTEASKTE